MIRDPEFDGQVPQEIVERRVEQCRVHRSEIRSIETSTATIIAILALYAAFFQTANISLADFTDLGGWAIVGGVYSWLLSFILAIFLDLRLRVEASTLTEMLDQYDHGGDLLSATQFFNRHSSNKFDLQTGLVQFLARIAPVLFLIGLMGAFRGGAFLGIFILVVLAFSLFPISLIFPPDGMPVYNRLRMVGWRMTIRWLWRGLKQLPAQSWNSLRRSIQRLGRIIKTSKRR